MVIIPTIIIILILFITFSRRKQIPKAYPKQIRDQADELLKQGLSEPQVAKKLGIPRSETIATWKKKYGIGIRLKTGSSLQADERPQDILKKSLDLWIDVQQITLKKLKELDFKSAEGAVQGLEIAEKCIDHLICIKKTFEDKQDETEDTDSDTSRKPKSKILEILSSG